MGEKKGAQSLWYTLKGYADRGWHVIFLTSKNNRNDDNIGSNSIAIKRLNDSFFRKLSQRKKIGFFFRPLWWIYFQIGMFFLASKIVKDHEINLLYGYEIFGTPVARFLSLRFKIKMVTRFQGTILKPKMAKKLWKLRHWHHYIGLKIPSDLIIMTNDGTEGDEVLSQLNTDMKKVKFWMNGVDQEVYKPDYDVLAFKNEKGLTPETKILLTVSRIEYWKRVDRIISALPEIVNNTSDVRLIIVGGGSEKENLEKLVKKLALEKYVLFTGSISHDKVSDFLNSADIFVSLYDLSNLGNPLLEAMMCAKCIVTLNNGDTGDYIKNNHNGILLDKKNLNRLPGIISDLLLDDRKRANLGTNAREFAVSNFWSWEDRMDAEVKTVEKLIV